MPTLNEPIIRRLGLIKYMFEDGMQRSRRPAPIFSMALLSFQDAVEAFLHLACEYHGIELKGQTQFLGYFSELKEKGPVSHRNSMDKLNRARVQFKHYGLLPNAQDMESHRVNVREFFEENTPRLFEGLAFKDISLASLVECAEARTHLENASRNWDNGDKAGAQSGLALAFDALLWEYRTSKTNMRFRPFDLGPSMNSAPRFTARNDDRRIKDFESDVKQSLKIMQKVLRVLIIGIDYRQYARFTMLTPQVFRTGAGPRVNYLSEMEISEDEFEFCVSFVVESALKLDDADFDVSLPSHPLVARDDGASSS